MVPVCRLFRWNIVLSSLSSSDMGRISSPVSLTKEILKKDETKPKRGLGSYTVATALTRYLLPFCSSQIYILVATTMTRTHC